MDKSPTKSTGLLAAFPSTRSRPNPTRESNLRSTTEIIAHLERCLKEGFRDDPADTPFLRGYEAALSLWKILLETGFIKPNSPIEEQLIPLCTKGNEDYRAGFLEALVHVNEDLSPVRRHFPDFVAKDRWRCV
jgi:hypothetical protein